MHSAGNAGVVWSIGDDGDVVPVSGASGGGELGPESAAVAAARELLMCWRIEGSRGRRGVRESMSSKLNRRVGVGGADVRGKTGSARLFLRPRRPIPIPPPPPPSLSLPPPAPPAAPPPELPFPFPPLRRPTKAGTLMRKREFRDNVDLGDASGCGGC
jgi:hypothetical protein